MIVAIGMTGTAYFLVTHGSSDPRSLDLMATLVAQVGQHRQREGGPVGGGCLEGMAQPLSAQLQQFGDRCRQAGCTTVRILPVFLLEGVHVMEDIPQAVAIARQSHPDLRFAILPYLGLHPQIPLLLRADFERNPACRRLLLSHGSRRAGANRPIVQLAETVGAAVAYWAVTPSIEVQLEALIAQGTEAIAILPYFVTFESLRPAIVQKIDGVRGRLRIELLPNVLSIERIVMLLRLASQNHC